MSDSEYSDNEVKHSVPQTVTYCPHCTFPLEFCEYGNSWDLCSQNLKKADPELLEKLSALRISSGKADNPVVEKAEKKKVSEDEDEDEDDDEDDKEEIEEVVVPVKAAKKEIILIVKERTKRKRITLVQGVETCGLKAKDIAKALSKKFATSASATDEGIALNGELDADIADYLLDAYPNDITESVFYTVVKGGMKRKYF